MSNPGDSGYTPRNQQQRETHQNALDSQRIFGEQVVQGRMSAEQDERRRLEESRRMRQEAEWIFMQGTRPPLHYGSVQPNVMQPDQPPKLILPPPRTPTPSELRAQKAAHERAVAEQQLAAAERERVNAEKNKQSAQANARASERSREIAARIRQRRRISNTLGLLLIIGFIPMFIGVFAAGPTHHYELGVLYLILLGAYRYFHEY